MMTRFKLILITHITRELTFLGLLMFHFIIHGQRERRRLDLLESNLRPRLTTPDGFP